MGDKMTLVSIIVPVFNEELYIQQFMDSIDNFSYPKKNMEIIIVDCTSSDSTRSVISKYSRNSSNIQLIVIPDQSVPKALNRAIYLSKGEIIIRLDAHSHYPPDYVTQLVNYSNSHSVDNVGGIVVTEVIGKGAFANAIKMVLSDKFGVGDSEFRTSRTLEAKNVDTVPYGCFKRSVFAKYGYYDERLNRNQDIELNKRIINNGGQITLLPWIKAVYYAPNSLLRLSKKMYANGLWNTYTVFITKDFRALSLRHFAPILLIFGLLGSLVLLEVPSVSVCWSILPPTLYLGILTARSFIILGRLNLSILRLVFTFSLVHISYGFGSLFGLLSVNKKIS